jgi:tetratricopeptide (TPR) repeat protein
LFPAIVIAMLECGGGSTTSVAIAPLPLPSAQPVARRPPPTPLDQAELTVGDPRPSRQNPRARGLLITEIVALEQLLAATPPTASDHPTIARRLAEDYGELEAGALQSTQTDSEHQTQASKIASKGHQKVIEDYTLIVRDHAQYAQLDEVLYYLALEYQLGDDVANARRCYLDLIRTKPDSTLVPSAYLAFGELFFKEAQGDQRDASKWAAAEQAYTEVVTRPSSNVSGYGWYKLAHVFWNEGKLPSARDAFQKAIDFGTAHPDALKASRLVEAARHDLGLMPASLSQERKRDRE